jgi:hypothetical protein
MYLNDITKYAHIYNAYFQLNTKIIVTLKLCQELVRFCADYRIKPHTPPLVLDPRQFL